MLPHICIVSFLIADLLAVTELPVFPPLSFLFLNLRQHRCCQCCVSTSSVTFPASSLALRSVSSDSAPAPLMCFHSGLMGRCASHCSVPGDHSSPAGFHQVLLTVPGPPGLPALILPDRLLSSAQTCSLFAASCAGQVSSPSSSSLFLQSVSGCGTLAFVRPHFEPPSHILCSFSQFYIFFEPTHLDIWFGQVYCLSCLSHSHAHTVCFFSGYFLLNWVVYVFWIGEWRQQLVNVTLSSWEQWMSFFNLAWHLVEQMAAAWVGYVTPLEVQRK